MKRILLLALAVLAVCVPGAAAAPDDALYGRHWSLQQLRAPDAWTTSTGAGQVIAIVDSGVDLTHHDLRDKLVPGATFTGCASAPNRSDAKRPRSSASTGP